MDSKAKQLEKIARQIARCAVCKKGKIGLPVPGEGNPDAEVIFIGEAPGKMESETGRPFVGRAGKLLRSLIKQAGINEEEVYITSPVKYLPKHGTPKPDEIKHGRTHLAKQLEIIKPKIAVLLGRVAVLAVLEKDCSIAQDHGKIIESNDISYFLSYHPAAALHAPNLRPVIVLDFKKLKKLIRKK